VIVIQPDRHKALAKEIIDRWRVELKEFEVAYTEAVEAGHKVTAFELDSKAITLYRCINELEALMVITGLETDNG